MMHRCLLILSVAFAVVTELPCAASTARAEEIPLQRILFGSCARENNPQPIWDAIVAQKPELFLFIGDNIYGDSQDMNVLRAKYKQLFDKPGFAKLRETCPLLVTWDDHDYGENDGGVEFPAKVESQKLFNEIYNVPEDSPRRRRPGVYDAQIFGPVGKRVQVILLDTRYFRDKLRPWDPKERPQGRGPYRPHEDDSDATVLGEAQWKWLREELAKPAEIRIIASSIQVIPYQHGWETWGNFPAERKRLFKLINDAHADGVIYISGDRHLAEISRIAPTESGAPYVLYDVTSSSLNQPSGGGNDKEPNRYRVGDNFLLINFGSIHVDWDRDDPVIDIAIHNGDGETVLKHQLKISQLNAASADDRATP